MDLPENFPNPERNRVAIQGLLDRIRTLDKPARGRLRAMLDEEMDLPYLDVMEREYARAFQRVAPDHAVALRGRFIQALNDQRAFLVALVRKTLQDCECNELRQSGASASLDA